MIRICELSEVPDGEGLQVEMDGLPALAVYRIGEVAYVIDDLCTHGDASLAEGELHVEDCYIECPFHSGGFDIRTGEAVAAPCIEPVKAYRTVVEDGAVFIEA